MLKREGSETQRRMASHIYDNGQNLLNMLTRIIEYSKVETGTLSLMPSECDVKSEIECCLEELGENDRIILELNVDELVFVTDAHILKRILTELVSNALAFSPEPSEATISVSWESKESGKEILRIDVRNKGPEIPPEKMTEIFMPGGKAGMYAKGYKEGLGLGLAYASQAAKLLNGSLTVSSTENSGNVFSLLLRSMNDHC